MKIFESLLLGIVQGLTEFLPVSSSGHLTLFQHLFGDSGGNSNMLMSVLLHIGTLVAVFIVYYKTVIELIIDLFKMIGDIFTGKFSFKNMDFTRRMLLMLILSTSFLCILIIPVKGKNLTDFADYIGKGNNMFIVGCCFLFTAALLLTAFFITKKLKDRHDNATVKDAVSIGLAQSLAAVFAGISRSGSTISTGLICGLKREYMVKYSFILSIPAILVANVFEAKKAIDAGVSVDVLPATIGIIAAIICGVFAIKAIEWIVKKDYYNYFGYYCAVLGVLVIAMSIVEKVNSVNNIIDLF